MVRNNNSFYIYKFIFLDFTEDTTKTRRTMLASANFRIFDSYFGAFDIRQ
jgi:hypothetical protein